MVESGIHLKILWQLNETVEMLTMVTMVALFWAVSVVKEPMKAAAVRVEKEDAGTMVAMVKALGQVKVEIV